MLLLAVVRGGSGDVAWLGCRGLRGLGYAVGKKKEKGERSQDTHKHTCHGWVSGVDD